MLKTTRLLNKPVSSKNNSSKLAFNRNNNNRLAFKKNYGNDEVDRFGVGKNSIKYAKKLEKLFKLGKSKSKKTFKSQNLAKSRKKLLKSENLTNFDATKARPKFLISDARTAFNHLQLAFTKALIL